MSQPIKILLSFLERKIIADLLPPLASKMKLDTENGRVLTFTQDEAGLFWMLPEIIILIFVA